MEKKSVWQNMISWRYTANRNIKLSSLRKCFVIFEAWFFDAVNVIVEEGI
jgi:hypothetical protein